jgi:hypothetical protein
MRYSFNQRMTKSSKAEIDHPMLSALTNALARRILISLA